jgi:LysR family transcriptional regulator, regulator for bpeEF and oprC
LNFNATHVFVKVVELGSFTRAGEVLKLPKSSISRVISKLEARLGQQLLYRTTRNLKLTTIGKAYFERCSAAVQEIEKAQTIILEGAQSIEGLVKLTAPEDLGSGLLSPYVKSLTRTYPKLSLELHYSDEVIDLVKEGYDLAIRMGRLSPSQFRSRKLGSIQMILVASRDYLENASPLTSPKDLERHTTLAFNVDKTENRWILTKKDQRVTVRLRPKIFSNHAKSLADLAKKGLGVTLLPEYICTSALKRGSLIRVLPSWKGKETPVHILSTSNRPMAARNQAVFDHFSKELSATLAQAL